MSRVSNEKERDGDVGPKVTVTLDGVRLSTALAVLAEQSGATFGSSGERSS
jgi:hypothetical protein